MAESPAQDDERRHDPEVYFAELLPETITRRTDLVARLSDITAVAQVDVRGDEGGVWHVVISDGQVGVGTGAHVNPSFVIQMAVATWRRIRRKELDPKLAFLSGKVRVSGDLAMLFRLAALVR